LNSDILAAAVDPFFFLSLKTSNHQVGNRYATISITFSFIFIDVLFMIYF